MRDYEVPRLLEVYHELIAILNPADAVKWLVSAQSILGDRHPYAMLSEREDFHRLRAVVKGLVNESKRTWRPKKPTA